MPDTEFVLKRTFDAPRALVYRVWTDPQHLRKWFGPKGFTLIPGLASDFRTGGTYHYGMRSPEGFEMWGKWVFRELTPPSRIVLVQSFSDAKGGMGRHPMAPTWPRETLSSATFTEADGRTTLDLRWAPIDATDEERQTFMASFASMEQGWGGTMAQLTEYLAQQKGRA